MAQKDKQTNTQTDGHGDSMTNSAKRAELVKILNFQDQKKKFIVTKKYFLSVGGSITIIMITPRIVGSILTLV